MKEIEEILMWFTPSKFIGLMFALGTSGYIFYLTIRYKSEFWDAFKGENKKLDVIEIVIIIWLVLFVSMTIADFTMGLHASEELWYSMDAVFLFAVGGKGYEARQRGVNPPKQ